VEVSLQGDGVLVEDQRVDVESEWDAGVSEFDDAVHRFEASCHADLDHVGAERAEAGDDVDVASADVRGTLLDAGDGFAYSPQLGLGLGVAGGVFDGVKLGQQVRVVGLLLAEFLQGGGHLLGGLLLVAEIGSSFPFGFLLLLL
jgi:hypothetical protein